jgi:predicted DNA binding protein
VKKALPTARTAPPDRRAGVRHPSEQTRRRLEGLRRHAENAEAQRLVVVTLRIRMAQDHWIGRFSNAHPELRIEAQTWTGLDARTSVLDYWIAGQPPGVWSREIESYPDVHGVEVLAEVADGCVYRVVQRSNPIVRLYRQLRMPLRFPLSIFGGVITWEVVSRKESFDRLLAFFRARKLQITIVSIRRGLVTGRLPVLTDSQRRLLDEAMSSGYFAVPRKVTLTQLAKRLGRNKSAVSESLALIEQKLLQNSLMPVRLGA